MVFETDLKPVAEECVLFSVGVDPGFSEGWGGVGGGGGGGC